MAKINKDFRALITDDYIRDMAVSHIEAWETRYRAYTSKRRLIEDLYVNHDDSLEIERAEEDLKRELTSEEETLLCKKFHAKVVNVWMKEYTMH